MAQQLKPGQRLLPCPFCGGEARLIRLGHQDGTAFDDHAVECVKCGAVPLVFSMFCNDDPDEIYEARKWNRRGGECSE